MKILDKIQIFFWKSYAIIWDLRPRKCPAKYSDKPIAFCDISDTYSYPDGVRVLFEWDEKGKHWIVFSR
jgi:hypothetical protein